MMKNFKIEKIDIPLELHKNLKDFYVPLLLNESKDPTKSVTKTNRGGWQSEVMVLNSGDQNPIELLASPVFDRLDELTSQLTLREETRLNMEYWFNVSFTNDYNHFHHHAGALLSGCYYLLKPENSGNIIFRPEDHYLVNYFEEDFDDVVECKEGDCLIFKPLLWHATEMNKSKKPRISIAFNIF